MMAASITASSCHWTAAELRKLPPDQRNAILLAAAAEAAADYYSDTLLTAFEAFGEGDLPVSQQ